MSPKRWSHEAEGCEMFLCHSKAHQAPMLSHGCIFQNRNIDDCHIYIYKRSNTATNLIIIYGFVILWLLVCCFNIQVGNLACTTEIEVS